MVYFNVRNFFTSSRLHALLLSGLLLFSMLQTTAQTNPRSLTPPKLPDTTKTLFSPVNPVDTVKKYNEEYFTLRQCIDYALQHQPALKSAIISTDIARATNAISLSAWLPQVNTSGNLLHYIERPNSNSVISLGAIGGTTAAGGTSTGNTGTAAGTGGTATTGVSTRGQTFKNTFVPGLTASQSIFSPALLYVSKSAPLLLKQAQQVTDSTKIFLVSSVSKSFYNVLLTLEQINVLKEDTTRLGQNLRDTYHQYKGGIVDETDYEEASITLNNSMAQLRQATENISPQYADLKQLMGYPPEKEFNVSFDTLEMARNIQIDTLRQLQYEKRIEYQELNTSRQLQSQLIRFYKYAFMPSLSAFYNYNLAYQNDKFSNLFNNSFPNSLVGLSFSIPIFTGFSRLHNLHRARLQEQLIDQEEVNLKSQIYKEYAIALASYKGNFYNLGLLQKNVNTAKRVYFVVTLQYKQGIVPYLNVITAESNLISSEISYLNAMFQVLSNKIDLEKAMGNITY